tara:strand:- start:5322 stop:6341 length:1020 start_codon:yes stop_codon:yes gene_type:complete
MKNNIKILFFGLGSIGQRHLINLYGILGKKVDFYAYRSRKRKLTMNTTVEKKTVDVIKKYKIKIIKDINKIEYENIDIIFITNPSSLHLNTALSLKNLKNKYIFIEKPLDASLVSYQKFKDLIKKNKLKIFVGYNLRFHQCVKKVQKILYGKKLGKIYQSTFRYGDDLRNWHKGEDYRTGYAANKKLGGGIVLSSIHEFDLMLALFRNAKIIKSYNDHLSNLIIDVEDFSVSVFKNNFLGSRIVSIISLNFFQINKERYIKIICEKGEILADLINFHVFIKTKNKTKKFTYKKNNNLMYQDEVKYFLKIFKNKKTFPPECNHLNALKTLKLALKVKSNH